MANSYEMDKKLAWLMARAKCSKIAKTFKHYDAKAEVGSLRTGWGKWSVSAVDVDSVALQNWFKTAQTDEFGEQLNFGNQNGQLKEFVNLPFSQWIQKFPPEIVSVVVDDEFQKSLIIVTGWLNGLKPRTSNPVEQNKGSSRRSDFSIFVEPQHHSVDLTGSWVNDGMIDQRFMYLSPYAVSYWQKTTSSRTYPTYERCLKTLDITLKHDVFQLGFSPIILGTGAPDKEELIFTHAINTNSILKPKIAMFDASFYMLLNSYVKLKNNVKSNIACDLYCMDFLSTESWDKYFLDINHPRSFFLLGNTIGNLDEMSVETLFDHICMSGDIVVIGGEFFETESDILAIKGELEARYRDSSVLDLVMSGVSDYISETFENTTKNDLRKMLGVELKSSAKMKKNKLKSRIDGTQSICFELNQEIALANITLPKGLNLGTSKRYVLDEFVKNLCSWCQFKLVEVVKHPNYPDERFQHIIFQKI